MNNRSETEYEVIRVIVDLKGKGELLLFSHWVSNLTHLCYKVSGLIYFSHNVPEFIDRCSRNEYWWHEPNLSESIRGKVDPKLESISISSPGFIEIANVASIAGFILNLLQIAMNIIRNRYRGVESSTALHNELKVVQAYKEIDKIHHELIKNITDDQLRDKVIAEHIEKFDRDLSKFLYGIFNNGEVKEIKASHLEKK
jgi:hypothetical protein